MLFNSYEFLFAFLPVALAGYYAFSHYHSTRLAVGWLVLSSLFFYGWWNPQYLSLIGVSILFNYFVGRQLYRFSGTAVAKPFLISSITANLGAIGYFKYAGFLTYTFNSAFGASYSVGNIILPLAISFFTFQQITYLVDIYRGQAYERNFLNYALFVSFFPQLIAGPIVHHSEMLPQFHRAETYRPKVSNFAIGLTIFLIGLVKKAVLADGVAVYATPVFVAADAGQALDFFTAWRGALAYTFQLYFDFSGYCDMAIGAARMFGILLPLNFNSPYKACNISDFWRRWHMTLSRFLRDYLYISLGGNRKGKTRRYVNLMVTMLLGGLWHGAGWTFVIWGGLHGIYLAIHQAWSRVIPARVSTHRSYRVVAWLITFLAVVIGWVFFRATTLEGAMNLLGGMIGLNGITLPLAVERTLGSFAYPLHLIGIEFTVSGGDLFFKSYALIMALAFLALVFPNTQELLARFNPALETMDEKTKYWIQWSPSTGWAVAVAIIGVVGILALPQVTEFLYFQF